MRLARRVYPVTGYHGNSFAVREDGRRTLTPLALALAAIVAADIAFAVDSIPAAFAITDDALVIWAANGFALLGLRALFVLVEELIRRFRYLNQTVAVVLGVVAVKLLIEDLYKVPPAGSLAIVLGLFAGGIVLSILADRRDAGEGGDPPSGAVPAGDAGCDRRGDARVRRLAQVGDLPRDLRLDVERRLAATSAALVAGDHELADLALEARVDGRPQQLGELRVDVDGRLAAAHAALVARGEHLTDLGFALGAARRDLCLADRAVGPVAQRHRALADLVVHPPRAGERDEPDDRRARHDHEQHDAERRLHRTQGRTMRPVGRPNDACSCTSRRPSGYH